MNYTYDDVMKKAAAYGLLDSMSDADRNLTMENPDAGMTVLNSRYDYKNATTDDARALAHSLAERTRMQYGGYSGGTDGSSFYVTEVSPQKYQQGNAPVFTDGYQNEQKVLTDKILNRGDYASSYGDAQMELLQKIGETADYSYDPASDPAYAAYVKQYRREGQRATADAMANAASLTGGIPSSAAVSAAGQAGQYYAAQLSDKLPGLEQAAYARNADRQAMLLNALNAANAADQTAYQRYLDDASFDYDNMELLRALKNDDYVQYRDALAQYNTDRDFNYGKFTDDLSYHRDQQRYEKELALQKEQYNDELAALEEEKRWNAALYALEYFNDSTLLKQLIQSMKEGE